jgi:hypothetical protein
VDTGFYDFYRTHLTSIVVSVNLVGYGFYVFCYHRPMISRLVAIELCKTACLCALFFKKRCQMGSIFSLSYRNQQLRSYYLEAPAEGNNSVYGNGATSVSSWVLVSITGIFSLSYRKSATLPGVAVAVPSLGWGFLSFPA